MAIAEAISAATERLSTQWPFVLTAVLACAVAFIIQMSRKSDPISKIPLVGAEFGDEAKRRQAYHERSREIVLGGYKKFKDGIFRMTTPRGLCGVVPLGDACNLLILAFDTESPVVVVAPRFLKELKDLPDDVVSFSDAIEEVTIAPSSCGRELAAFPCHNTN